MNRILLILFGAAAALLVVNTVIVVVVWRNLTDLRRDITELRAPTSRGPESARSGKSGPSRSPLAAAEARLAMPQRVEQAIPLTGHDGQPRDFNSLKGKVIVVGWLYTTCPRGCAGLAVEMKKLQEEFGADPRFHLVAVSLDPVADTPQQLKAFADAHGLGGDNWWLVTGDERELIPWMEKHFGLWRKAMEAKDRLSPEDKWEHPVAMRPIDHRGFVRGNELFYPHHPPFGGRYFPRDIREDIRKLLTEAEKAEPGAH